MERLSGNKSGYENNILRLREIFPQCVSEVIDEQGNIRLSVDLDKLSTELLDDFEIPSKERYHLTWPGKSAALAKSNAPTTNVLRPNMEASQGFESTSNLFITGDNLEALKIIQESYLGMIKMIYIDPPYNTGNDFIYNDKFSIEPNKYKEISGQIDDVSNKMFANFETNGRFHSDWLSMIYPRLKIARNLLRDDGLIFISIDDGEVANLRKICDEIFGESNFVAQIAWEKRYTRSNNAKRFYSLKDNILVFRKSEALDTIKEARSEKADANYKNPDGDPRGPWMTASYVNPATKDQRPNLVYGIENPYTKNIVNHPTHAWKYSKQENESHIRENKLWWGKDGSADYPRIKLFLQEQTSGLVPVDLWDYKSSGTTDEGGQEIKELFGSAIFDTPKPTRLIERMLGIATNATSNDIVLDFFAGSASTAHAVMKSNLADGGNRRYIMVQLPEPTPQNSEAGKAGFVNIASIAQERIRRAAQKIRSGAASGAPLPDLGFRVLEVDSSNNSDVLRSPNDSDQMSLLQAIENFKPDRTPEDLLFEILVNWGLDLSLPIRSELIQNKRVFRVDEDALVACFDTELSENFVKELTSLQPLRVVFRDNGFISDATKINAEQIFRQLSPGTDVKTI